MATLSGFYGWTDTLKGVYYGPGVIQAALPKLLSTLSGTKALIVTGKTLYHKTDVVKTVESILRANNAYGATFYDIGEHSPIAGIRAGVSAFRDSGCDIIVSVGGGSPIDASKAILYYIQPERGGPMPLQIAVPTTLSAAEYTVGAGFTDEKGNKTGVMSPELAPAGIILDAELTLATPERLWLSTGMRALDHAVENLYRQVTPIPLKALAYAAIADLFEYLPKSKADPGSVEVRQKLQIASWMSLWPLRQDAGQFAPLGLSHGLGHKLGATYGIPHGITSCLTLASVVALQAEIGSEDDKQSLSKALFYIQEPSSGDLKRDVLTLASRIHGLVESLGLASSLEGYKVPKEDFTKIAAQTVGSNGPLHAKVLGLLNDIYVPGFKVGA
ncbi:Dehydroquinate synthase-like protein [Schizophyllum commune H4-8]|uniref:Uncharacterized protein n=1 Tax=Schizophyllum commune (strain H4-8 / FGSC 9210) TaxID=578458 RepID=D8QC50_SCHCM|nr:Dehydroquinate synthase-like protein [Schizophyllum commune H4-8]KAI5889438.1 Dehydroquinate synthase-like protein [Schizophyllum commune H4-8]